MVTSTGCGAQFSAFLPGPIGRNPIHYCIELHSRLNWPDVKSANQTHKGRHPRKAVRGGGARVRGTGYRRGQQRGGRGGGRASTPGGCFLTSKARTTTY